MKKLFISADIEGVCGVCHWDETSPGAKDGLYNLYREQMTREVAAACRGALSAGFGDIVVKDAHGSARNLLHAGLPREVRLNRGWSGDLLAMVSGLSREGFGAIGFVGYHDAAFSGGNPLAHTMTGSLEEVWVNGAVASEFLLYATTAAYLGVPAVFISGDGGICARARELCPGITAVAVKEGDGGSVTSLHPEVAAERIEAGMREALEGDLSACLAPLPAEFEMRIRYTTFQKAEGPAHYPGAERLGLKTVAFRHTDWMEVLRFFHFAH